VDRQLRLRSRAKLGIAHTTLKEVAVSFEVSLATLKSTLGGKAGLSTTITDEQTASYKRTITAEKCRGLTYAEWQRIERTTITAAEKQWFGLRKPKQVSRVIDDPVNVFVADSVFEDAGERFPFSLATRHGLKPARFLSYISIARIGISDRLPSDALKEAVL
jgi:hypothetical protein